MSGVNGADEDDSVRLIQPDEPSNSPYARLSTDRHLPELPELHNGYAPHPDVSAQSACLMKATDISEAGGNDSDEVASAADRLSLPKPGSVVAMKEIVAGNMIDSTPVNEVDPQVAAYWLKYVGNTSFNSFQFS
jgi:hypothetical protein